MAAPTVTASGPSPPRSIVTRSAGCRSAYPAACRRTSGSRAAPSLSPAHPPIRMRSGRKRLIRSDRPAPMYSAVSSSRPRATASSAAAATSAASALSWSRRLSARLPPAFEEGLGPGVRLQAPRRTAPAAAPRDPYRQMPGLDGPALLRLRGDDARADAGAEQHHDRAAGAAPRPEPHLRLAERARAVVDEVRDGGGQFAALPEQ